MGPTNGDQQCEDPCLGSRHLKHGAGWYRTWAHEKSRNGRLLRGGQCDPSGTGGNSHGRGPLEPLSLICAAGFHTKGNSRLSRSAAPPAGVFRVRFMDTLIDFDSLYRGRGHDGLRRHGGHG